VRDREMEGERAGGKAREGWTRVREGGRAGKGKRKRDGEGKRNKERKRDRGQKDKFWWNSQKTLPTLQCRYGPGISSGLQLSAFR
jgi:hypothetical protein